MTEAEILDAFQTSYSMQITLLTQIVGLHLAMIVGIYYFLARARLALKIFAFVVYTTSYVTFVVMAMSQSLIGLWLSSVSAHYLEGGENNPLVSFLNRLQTSWLSMTVSVAANLMFLALWFGTAYFLFFYRQPAPAGPALAETPPPPELSAPEPAPEQDAPPAPDPAISAPPPAAEPEDRHDPPPPGSSA